MNPIQTSNTRSNLQTVPVTLPGGLPSISGQSNQTLPIRLTLDFSDEKAQHLFIYEQKYNMKKNDCFNLEKQKSQMLKELSHRNSEFEKL